ncbi:MAG TPA: hypothetical protein VF789_03550 [Thermoanaerobaculia bacterium]
MSRNLKRSCAAGLLAFLAATASEAAAAAPAKLAYHPQVPAVHPNLARGLDLGSRYDDDGFTAVNLFNGNLLAALNLGPSYPVDARLSYALALHYNSQVWDFQAGGGEGRPASLANAGLGFDLSLGRLLAPGSGLNGTAQWMYVAPDGSPHLFYSDLHHDTPDPGDAADAARYTRDGTYLRLRTVSAAEMRVEHPDGTWRVFAAAGGAWRLARLASPSGLGVDVSYAADGTAWTLADSHGRTHTVTFASDGIGKTPRLVDRVELAAFGGARAVWDFTYANVAVPRDCADPRGGTETVALLTSITDPMGAVQTFDYHTTGCAGGGRLRRLKLPSGGFLEWTYASWSFPPFDCSGTTPAYYRTVSGVASRKRVLPDNTVAGTWTYTVESDAAAGAACGLDGRRTVVATPLGDKTVYHFAAGTLAQHAGGPALYALPVAPTRPDAGGQLHLAKEVYDCGPAGDSCALLRSVWERWEQDQACASVTGTCFDTNRRLARTKTVYLDDAPPAGGERFSEIASSGYDGLGNYRVTLRTSNFGRSDSLRTTRMTNPDSGAYPPVLGTFTVPGLTSPWVLQDYTYQELMDEAGAKVRADACFSADGWLLRTRRRADAAAPSSHDLVNLQTWNAGQMTETGFFGGDLQTLGTEADLCALHLPAPAAGIRRAYAYGSLSRETDLDAGGSLLSFHRVDRDIDDDTGLTAAERDVAGLATVFQYDLLGRETWRKPAEDSWVQSVHDAPNGGSAWNSGPRTTVYYRPNGGGAALQSAILLHDVFGRRTGEWTSQPGATYTGRLWQYNAQGFVTAESNAYLPGTPSTLSWTQFLNHDPFGRPRTVRPAEGAAHDETRVYLGERETRRTYKAGKAYVGITRTCYEDDVTETTFHDGQGRRWLRRVAQPQPLPGRTDEVESAYTPAGQLRSEIHRLTVGASSRVTATEHQVDGRGLVLATTIRQGTRVAATTEFEDFDARGLHHRETLTGDLHPAPGVTVQRTYDDAGRLVTVADGADSSKLWKQFFYGDENDGANRRRGRMTSSVRHNYFEGAHHTVTESFVYAGTGGRVSEKTVAIATVQSPSHELRMDKSYRLTAAYDALGNPTSVGFPSCLTCSPGEPQAAFTLTPSYSHSHLTALGGTRGGAAESWLAGVAWSLSGRQREVTHANGLKDVFEPDAFNRPRPSSVRVQTTGGAVRFDSGPIVYDGAGNRCGAGDRSAVVPPFAAVAEEPAMSGPCAMPYAFDPFAQWNGEIPDLDCRGASPPSLRLFDASDRPVAVLNRNAVKPLDVQNQTFWVADPDNFVRTWRLIGLDGRLMTEVEDRATLAWRSRTDFIHALGDLQGKAIQTSTAPGFVQQVHKHPLGVRNTGANGNPLANEM